MRPSETKRGHVIRYNDNLWKVVGVTHLTPGNKRAIFQIDMKSLAHGRTLTHRFASHDNIEFVNVDTRTMQYLYKDGEHYVFMDLEDYEQVFINADDIAEQIVFLKEEGEVKVQFVDDKPIGLEMPAAVVLQITKCDPGMKGDSVSNVFKPATLETGHVIKVPLYMAEGQMVKVDTRSGEFLERVNT